MNVRRSVAATVLSLSLLSLAACGEDAAGLEAVKISATAGKAPTISYGDDFAPEKDEIKVLKAGKGAKAGKKSAVKAHVWISNSVDDKVVFDTYAEGQEAIEILVEDVMPGIRKGLEDQQEGAVVAVAGPANELFTEYGYPEWGIGNGDAVVIRTELVEVYDAKGTADFVKRQEELQKEAEKAQKEAEAKQKEMEEKQAAAKKISDKLAPIAQKNALSKPQGKARKAASWAPKMDYSTDVPTFDFTGTPKPSKKLLVTTLIEGKGKVVKKGQAVAVRYVGQIHGQKEPFDNNFAPEPGLLPFVVGDEFGVIPGFSKGVEGQRVGSRIIISIPPSEGYTQDAGTIKAGVDTLVFAVDILGAS